MEQVLNQRVAAAEVATQFRYYDKGEFAFQHDCWSSVCSTGCRMASNPTDSATASIQTIVAASVALYVVFATTYPSLSVSLREGRAVLHLYTWLQLKQFANTLPKSSEIKMTLDVHDSCPQGYKFRIVGTKYTPECPYERIAIKDVTRYSGYRFSPLMIETIWPETSQSNVYLYRQSGGSDFSHIGPDTSPRLKNGKRAEFFDVLAPDSPLPVDHYELMRLQDDACEHFLILQKGPGYGHVYTQVFATGKPDLTYLAYDSELNEPEDWSLARLMLLRVGIRERPDKLSLDDKELLKFITATGQEASTVSVLGINIPVLTACSFFQAILALLAFWTIGPLRVLKSVTAGEIDRTWLMLWPASSARDPVEVILTLVSILFVLSPIAILAAQLISGVLDYSSTLSVGLTGLNLFSCAVAVAVFRRLAIVLRDLRLAKSPRLGPISDNIASSIPGVVSQQSPNDKEFREATAPDPGAAEDT